MDLWLPHPTGVYFTRWVERMCAVGLVWIRTDLSIIIKATFLTVLNIHLEFSILTRFFKENTGIYEFRNDSCAAYDMKCCETHVNVFPKVDPRKLQDWNVRVLMRWHYGVNVGISFYCGCHDPGVGVDHSFGLRDFRIGKIRLKKIGQWSTTRVRSQGSPEHERVLVHTKK